MTNPVKARSREEAIALIVKGTSSNIELAFDATDEAFAELASMGQLCGINVTRAHALPHVDARPHLASGFNDHETYVIRRRDGQDQPGGVHHKCRKFVLDIDHDPFARQALQAYATAAEATHPEMATRIFKLLEASPSPTPF